MGNDYFTWELNRGISRYKGEFQSRFDPDATSSDLQELAAIGHVVEVAINCHPGDLMTRLNDFWSIERSTRMKDFVNSIKILGDMSVPENRMCRGDIGAWYIASRIEEFGQIAAAVSRYHKGDISGAAKRTHFLNAAGSIRGGKFRDEIIPFSLTEREVVHFRLAGAFTNELYEIKAREGTAQL